MLCWTIYCTAKINRCVWKCEIEHGWANGLLIDQCLFFRVFAGFRAFAVQTVSGKQGLMVHETRRLLKVQPTKQRASPLRRTYAAGQVSWEYIHHSAAALFSQEETKAQCGVFARPGRTLRKLRVPSKDMRPALALAPPANKFAGCVTPNLLKQVPAFLNRLQPVWICTGADFNLRRRTPA